MKKRGVALVMTIFFLAFFLAIGLNMFFISLGKVKREINYKGIGKNVIAYDLAYYEVQEIDKIFKECEVYKGTLLYLVKLASKLVENDYKIKDVTTWEKNIGETYEVIVNLTETEIKNIEINVGEEKFLKIDSDGIVKILDSLEKTK